MPEDRGTVQHLALSMVNPPSLQTDYLKVVNHLVGTMPGARFTILVPGSCEKEALSRERTDWSGRLGSWLGRRQALPERVQVVESDRLGSRWIQDSTLVSADRLLIPERHWAAHEFDLGVAPILAQLDSALTCEDAVGLFLDGGNQRATPDKIFVGSDAIELACKDLERYPGKYTQQAALFELPESKMATPESLVRSLMEARFPSQTIEVVEQAAYHVDLFLTPLGQDRDGKPGLLIGDPRGAVATLETLRQQKPRRYQSAQRRLGPDDALDRLIEVNRNHRAGDILDQMAETYGDDHEVRRVPMLASEDSGAPFVSYNNSIIDGRAAHLPTTGVPELDRDGCQAYQDFGYLVLPVEMPQLARSNGLLNCMAKVTERQY